MFYIFSFMSFPKFRMKMSVVHIPGVKDDASPEQATISKMLAENSQLIEAIAEYQRMGRIEDSVKYQELLHRNLMYLGNLADASLVQQIQVDFYYWGLNSMSSVPAQIHVIGNTE